MGHSQIVGMKQSLKISGMKQSLNMTEHKKNVWPISSILSCMSVRFNRLHMNKAYSIEITQTRYRYNGRKMNFISDSFENSFWNKIFRFLEAIYKIRLFSIIISSYVVHTLAFTDGFLIRMAFIRMDLVILRAISNRTICEMWEESVQFGC